MSKSEIAKEHESFENPKENKGTSRRNFIKGAVASSALLGLAGILQSCQDVDSPVEETAAGSASEYPIQVHEADVVVVGSGIAGSAAAIRAIAYGASVIIVDKGPYGRSGTSGMNWGHGYSSPDFCENNMAMVAGVVGQCLFSNEGMVHQDYAAALAQAAIDLRPTLFGEQLGMITERMRDGEPFSHNKPMREGLANTQSYGWFPRFIAQRAAFVGSKIFDHTMVIDVLLDDSGTTAGVIAIDLKSGDAHVFRAKSVILATGCYNWVCGWNEGMSPWTIAGPEATGDGTAMFLGLGLPVGNLEFTPHDSPPLFPTALRQSMGLAFEFPNYYAAFNSEGKYFMNDHFTAHPEDIGQGVLSRLTAKQVIDGLGNEWGGVWLNTTTIATGERFYRRYPDILKRNFNYELPDSVPVAPEFWGSYAAPDKLTATSETLIPGLYYAGAPYYGFNLPGGLACGWMTGKGAAERAFNTKRTAVPWTKVNDVLKKAYDTLEANPTNPIGARQVMRNAQKGYGRGLLLVRNEQGINDAIDELERVKAEDIPNMFVRSKSRSFNTDWRNALEIPFMVNVGIAAGKAALERRESRMTHVREDYPKVDDENFLRRIVVTQNGDTFTTELIDCDYSLIPKETVSDMICKVSFDYDQSLDPNLPFTPLPEHTPES